MLSAELIGTNIFAGAWGAGVFLSTDNGSSWNAINAGLTDLDVLSLAVKGDTLFAGTFSSGVWKRPLSEIITSADDIQIGLPTDFILKQNYPNPFNPSTKIRYSIPSVIGNEVKQSQFVSLKVYDIIGNEVATLVNEEQFAGSYEVEFNSSGHSGEVRNLPSGIYFYKLQAGNPSTGSGQVFTETKKMLLIK
ncbi:MAG: hypothetical protein MUE91_06645 [Ignavibacteriaceae bacterium]|nr:hypothetical protein [Ignavibacteriaceae bacterium]